jgi:hypothetical protein
MMINHITPTSKSVPQGWPGLAITRSPGRITLHILEESPQVQGTWSGSKELAKPNSHGHGDTQGEVVPLCVLLLSTLCKTKLLIHRHDMLYIRQPRHRMLVMLCLTYAYLE